MSPLTYVIRLLRWFEGKPRAFALVIFCIVIEMGFNAFVPMAFSHLIDKGITPLNATVLIHTLLLLGAATILAMSAGLTSDFTYARLAADVLARMRQRLYDHLQTLSPAFFQSYSAGEVSSRYTNDLVAIEQTLGTWIGSCWKPLLNVLGYNVVMFVVDWRLALFAQLLWPMTLLGPRIFGPRQRGRRGAEELGDGKCSPPSTRPRPAATSCAPSASRRT